MKLTVQKTVYTAIKGGLGNQMFQYAAGKSLASVAGCGLKLDLSFYDKPGRATPRDYRLNVFRLDPTIAGASELAAVKGSLSKMFLRSRKRRKKARTLLRPLGRWITGNVYEEPHYHFDPGLFECRAPVLIDGYWQSERYFAGIGDIIRRDFRLREPLSEDSLRMAEEIAEASVSVSVHVRRGDMANNPAIHANFGVCSLDYYRRAIDLIRACQPDPRFFVFSDEPDYVRRTFDFCPDHRLVDGNADRPEEDMFLMSQCDHQIIANSSFSWWGAWLNERPDKVVIAPRQWFSAAKLQRRNTMDLYPDGWFTLA